MVLPLLKLGTLFVKTLSKPVAHRLKQQAGLHPRFRQLIINLAQANHRITTKMQRRIYSHSTDVEIRPLNEEKAVQAAVDLIGEVFVFSVAGAALIFEVQRSSRSEARKEELRKQQLERIVKPQQKKLHRGSHEEMHMTYLFQRVITSPRHIHKHSNCKTETDKEDGFPVCIILELLPGKRSTGQKDVASSGQDRS